MENNEFVEIMHSMLDKESTDLDAPMHLELHPLTDEERESLRCPDDVIARMNAEGQADLAVGFPV